MPLLEERLQRDFPLEYAAVESRLDPVLCGLANDMFEGAGPEFGLAASAMVLDACRRNLSERFGREDVDLAVGLAFRDAIEKRTETALLAAAAQAAAGHAGVTEQAWAETTRRVGRRGFLRGLAAGCLAAPLLLAVLRWILP